MRIVITGAGGQLGCELQQVLRSHDLTLLDLPTFDLSQPRSEDRIIEVNPDVVIHAAAYTDVDGAEREPARAMLINADGTERVAQAAAKVGARLLYISTDYVFDGEKRTPYLETDTPNPLNVYGRSKLEGEQRALAVCHDTLVVRTAWLYGKSGRNFVKTIMRLATERPVLAIVADQRGAPTHAGDLAAALEKLLATDLCGVVHATNTGNCTWHEFAKEIVSLISPATSVEPISSAEAGRLARRPAYSVLSLERVRQAGIVMPEWREALGRFMHEMHVPTPAQAS